MGVDTLIYFKAAGDHHVSHYQNILCHQPGVCGVKLAKFGPNGATHEVVAVWRWWSPDYRRGYWPHIAALLMELYADPSVGTVWYIPDHSYGDDVPPFTPEMLLEYCAVYMKGPCHEPQPQPDPTPTGGCNWWQDEFRNWYRSCSDIMPGFTPWPGTDPNGSFCPKCGKIITVRVHDKP